MWLHPFLYLLACWACGIGPWRGRLSSFSGIHCWLGHLTCKIVSEMTYNVSSGTLNPTISYHISCSCLTFAMLITCPSWWDIDPRRPCGSKNRPPFHFQARYCMRQPNLLLVYYCLSNAFGRLSNHFGFCPCVCVSVCPPIGCRTITSAILYRFSPNFACRSEMWLFRGLLFLGQTGSRLPILEMCKVRFWQFRDCGGHIFPRIVTKTLPEM